ncbi:MAG: hypothetical protein COY19_04085 [Candidatus Marinimicrobia bacterium CG_4_10_14_0_2_um_filter_48_9]|nr:MAG: hypothetical protein COY19_04085 [Candidatus Marinimicrobia bacterium CG_4_10_14_0_2_um_filter_48_9]
MHWRWLKYGLSVFLMMTGLRAQSPEQGKLLYDLGIFIQDTVAVPPVDSTQALEMPSDTNAVKSAENSPVEVPTAPASQPTENMKPTMKPADQQPLLGGDMDLYQLVLDYQIRVARMELEIAKLYRGIDSLKTSLAEQGAGYRTDLAILEKQNRLLGKNLVELESRVEVVSNPVQSENSLAVHADSTRDSIWNEAASIPAEAVASLQSRPDQPNRTEEQIYRDGLTKYHRQSYLSALDDFKRLTAYGQNEDLKASAQYYAGACYFALGLMNPAEQELTLVSKYNASDKLDDALALRGIIYEKQGRMKEAQAVFEHLIDQYPGSDYVMVATRFLQRARKLSQHE